MRDRRWLPELDEHDRDVYESELMYDRWLWGRTVETVAISEGYDPSLDDPNGYVGADERERDAKGEQ